MLGDSVRGRVSHCNLGSSHTTTSSDVSIYHTSCIRLSPERRFDLCAFAELSLAVDDVLYGHLLRLTSELVILMVLPLRLHYLSSNFTPEPNPPLQISDSKLSTKIKERDDVTGVVQGRSRNLSSKLNKSPLSSAERVWQAGADVYFNRYRNGWSASAAAARQAMDEVSRPGRRKITNALTSSTMPQPVPMSRFQWPHTQVPITLSPIGS